MAVYIVFTREKTINNEELTTYANTVGSTLAGHPVTVLASYGEQIILEGQPSEGTVILEFPSKEEALAWYNSPTYQEVVKHRFNGAIYSAVLIEGVPTK